MITFMNNSDSEEEACNERTSLMSAESSLLPPYHDGVQASGTTETQTHRVGEFCFWKENNRLSCIMLVLFILQKGWQSSGIPDVLDYGSHDPLLLAKLAGASRTAMVNL